jgi:hypothetical protein
MPLNINFNKTNDAIKMMLNLMMEKKMGDLTGKRQMDVASYQDKLIRDRMAEEDVKARGLKEYGADINVKEYLKKTLMDVASKEEPYNNAIKSAQVYRSQGMEKEANQAYGTGLAVAGPAIDAALASLEGKVGKENLEATLRALGPTGMKDLLDQTVGAQKQKLEVDKFGLEKQKFGLEQQKFGAEQKGQGALKKTDYYTMWHTKIYNMKGFLTKMKDVLESGGEPGGDPTISFEWKKLFDSPMTPKLLGQALTKLEALDTKAMNPSTPLSPRDITWLNGVQDIAVLQEQSPLGVSSEDAARLEQQTNQAIQNEAPKVSAPPPVVAQSPTISGADLPPGTYIEVNPQTGERKAYINGQWIRIR